MATLEERALRVAMSGNVPTDDPWIIAEMQAEIDRLRGVVAKSAEILKRNLGHQTEKCYDALSILQRAIRETE